MSRTKETKLLMESWRKFLNEEDMADKVDSPEETEMDGQSIANFFRNLADGNYPEIFWDKDEENFYMITGMPEGEIQATPYTPPDDEVRVKTYPMTGNYIGSGVESDISVKDALEGSAQLDGNEIEYFTFEQFEKPEKYFGMQEMINLALEK